jgi:hypothetical protein
VREEPDPAAQRGRFPQGLALERHASRGGTREAGKNTQQSGLPRSVGTEDQVERAGLDAKVDAPENPRIPEGALDPGSGEDGHAG